MSYQRDQSYNIQKEAKQILMTIDEEQQTQYTYYEPYRAGLNHNNILNNHFRNKKMRTQASSPNIRKLPRLSISGKKELKQMLTRLEQQENVQEKKSLALEPLSLNSINLNYQGSQRKIEDIYNSRKKSSEKKIRPVVYIAENTNQELQEQKIRSLIKRKVLAKDLFRKALVTSQNRLFKHKSELKGFKKNLLFVNRYDERKFPHIV